MAARLAEASGHPSLAFWPQQISLLQEGLIRWERILGPRQISAAYLLALAVAHGGQLVSFDQRLDPQQVPGASANHLWVIPAGGAAACGAAQVMQWPEDSSRDVPLALDGVLHPYGL